MKACLLDVRGIIAIGGEDRTTFLQGLVSNDVTLVSAGQVIYAAMLTPQGKYLFDFFILEYDGRYLLETEAQRRFELIQKLSMYRLRSRIHLEDVTDRFRVATVLGIDAPRSFDLPNVRGVARKIGDALAFVDPRLCALGIRILANAAPLQTLLNDKTELLPIDAYEQLRLELGVPDGSRDLRVTQSTLLENNFEALHGLSWTKGCYVGQEVTARMKYRGLLKKQLLPVRIDGPSPRPGTSVTLAQKEIGEMCTNRGGYGLARLRLDSVARVAQTGQPLIADKATIMPYRPSWLGALNETDR